SALCFDILWKKQYLMQKYMKILYILPCVLTKCESDSMQKYMKTLYILPCVLTYCESD
ncbi:hypothetical protein CEXT_427311, partial [Caerostris extrusa]